MMLVYGYRYSNSEPITFVLNVNRQILIGTDGQRVDSITFFPCQLPENQAKLNLQNITAPRLKVVVQNLLQIADDSIEKIRVFPTKIEVYTHDETLEDKAKKALLLSRCIDAIIC